MNTYDDKQQKSVTREQRRRRRRADRARGDDPFGYRAGFLTLVDLARGLDGS